MFNWPAERVVPPECVLLLTSVNTPFPVLTNARVAAGLYYTGEDRTGAVATDRQGRRTRYGAIHDTTARQPANGIAMAGQIQRAVEKDASIAVAPRG